ncbi:hypothetical protein [Streptomyces indiaensis]|nr:hypothetical protein [Streptomyces indiaensis]
MKAPLAAWGISPGPALVRPGGILGTIVELVTVHRTTVTRVART